MKKIITLSVAALMLLSASGCGDKNEETEDMPENIISYENRENSEFIPNEGVEEHGNVVEATEEIPSEDELGEYQEIFMGGDILEDGSMAGWVLAVSLKDITVNTYNEITTYDLGGSAENCSDYIEPGDAVLFSYTEDDEGVKTIYEIGRVRVEDEALTQEEIEDMYQESMGDTTDTVEE